MSVTAALFLAFGIWILIGISTALAMRRRGQHPVTWGVLGAVFGPLVIPWAISTLRQHQEAMTETVHAGTTGRGRFDIRIGVDGSDDATMPVLIVGNLRAAAATVTARFS